MEGWDGRGMGCRDGMEWKSNGSCEVGNEMIHASRDIGV